MRACFRLGPIAPAPAPTFASVPDLKELIALPQDEMTDIVQRFRGPARAADAAAMAAGRTGRGLAAAWRRRRSGRSRAGGAGQSAGPGAPAAGQSRRRDARPRQFYEDWLKALKTLDFDKLSRNAQVDYLYIRKMAELQIARAGVTLARQPAAQGRHDRAFPARRAAGRASSSTCRTS